MKFLNIKNEIFNISVYSSVYCEVIINKITSAYNFYCLTRFVQK